MHEIVVREQRLGAIAREYAREPQGTLVISPDNESRRELNTLIRRQMQTRSDVNPEEHKLRVLDSRHEMTGADRQWAAQYEERDLVRYTLFRQFEADRRCFTFANSFPSLRSRRYCLPRCSRRHPNHHRPLNRHRSNNRSPDRNVPTMAPTSTAREKQ